MAEALIVAPDTLFREGLERVVGDTWPSTSVGTLNEAHQRLRDGLQPRLLLLDVAAFEIEPLRSVCETSPALRVIVVLDAPTIPPGFAEMREGCVHGCVLKDISAEALAHSIALVLDGQFVLPHSVATLMLWSGRPAGVAPEDPVVALTARERGVLAQLGAGHSNKQIARELNISVATVKVHVKSVLRKLKVNSRTQAALWSAGHE
jgi:two-component system, NarL family, nitrate/nitrite response regulator NarL